MRTFQEVYYLFSLVTHQLRRLCPFEPASLSFGCAVLYPEKVIALSRIWRHLLSPKRIHAVSFFFFFFFLFLFLLLAAAAAVVVLVICRFRDAHWKIKRKRKKKKKKKKPTLKKQMRNCWSLDVTALISTRY